MQQCFLTEALSLIQNDCVSVVALQACAPRLDQKYMFRSIALANDLVVLFEFHRHEGLGQSVELGLWNARKDVKGHEKCHSHVVLEDILEAAQHHVENIGGNRVASTSGSRNDVGCSGLMEHEGPLSKVIPSGESDIDCLDRRIMLMIFIHDLANHAAFLNHKHLFPNVTLSDDHLPLGKFLHFNSLGESAHLGLVQSFQHVDIPQEGLDVVNV
mmetsp:Transcript_14290/g.29365  ORF Transcript_14290/g.29365 Transcript_14290/m.29365 type:complete len:214 (+) Transcript_14290:1249-1890(+)